MGEGRYRMTEQVVLGWLLAFVTSVAIIAIVLAWV
jgi:hypothetical protein